MSVHTNSPVDGDRYLNPKLIAAQMDVSVDTVLAMAREGILEGVRFGRQIRIKQSSFHQYLETHKLDAAHGDREQLE